LFISRDTEEDEKELLRFRLEDLGTFEFPSLPPFFDDPSDDEAEALGLTFPATPLDSPSDSEV